MAACLGDGPERGWLAHLASHDAGVSLTFVDNRVALIRRVRALRPHVVLLPLRDTRGVPSAPLIARLREHAPNVRVLLLVAPGSSRAGLADAIRAGGEAAVLGGEEELRAVLFHCGDIGPLSVQEHDATCALLADVRPAELRATLLFCVMHAHRRLSVGDVATERGMSARVFGLRARVARWPAATELIDWGRLLRASVLQWCETAAITALAHASGFPSTRALQVAAERLLQRSAECPSDLSPLLVGARLRRRVHRMAVAGTSGRKRLNSAADMRN